MNRAIKLGAFLVVTLCLLGCVSLALADTVTTSINVSLSLTGTKPPSTSDFTFVLVPKVAGAPMPAANTLTIAGAGNGVFGPISYSAPNEYVYTLYQTPGNVTGYTYDNRVYTVTVQVNSDATGKLTATVYLKDGSGKKTTQVAFSNKYAVNTVIPKTGYELPATDLWTQMFDYISQMSVGRFQKAQ